MAQYLNKNEKQIVKIQKSKILKKWKNGQEMWWIATFPQNMAFIRLIVSEKTCLTDGRWTTTHLSMVLPLPVN